ncbi:MAG: TonB-dependent receptor [Moraxellaceae bacterium]|nr:TonB-dependent receptor [Moraxellaceae bacterium]
MKALSYALAPLALAISAPSLSANTSELDEVVITASRSVQTTGVNTAYIDVISEEDIKASGAQTVLDALRRSATIQVVDSVGNGSSPTIGMRGFGSNGSQNTLILIDGRRLNNDTDLSSVNLRNLSINNVARIEIVNGSAGALYGAGAVGGIINIITKRANGNQLDLSVSRGNYDTEKYRARASAQKDAWSVVVVGDKELSDGYRDNNDLNNAFGQARIAYDGKRFSSYVETSKLDQKANLAGSLTAAQVRQNRRQTNTPNDFSNIKATRLSLGGSIALNDQWLLTLDTSKRKDELDSEFSSFRFAQSRDQITLSPKLQGSFNMLERKQSIIVGQDIERGRYEAFGSIGKPKTNSSYVQLTSSLTDRVDLVTGYRYGTHVNNISFTPKVSDSVSAGSVGVFWKATDRTNAWLRADQNFRFATIDEHTFTATGSTLDTQTGQSFEAGIEHRINQHKLKAQIYQLELKKEITFDPSAGFFGANINLDPTKRRGISLSTDSKLTEKLDAQLQVGLVDGKFTAGSFDGQRIPHVPKTSITAALNYQPLEKTTVALESQYTGNKFADSDFNNTSKVKAVLVHNMAVTQQWKDFSASVRINNVLDKKYNDYTVLNFLGEPAFYPAAERNALLTVSYHLK